MKKIFLIGAVLITAYAFIDAQTDVDAWKISKVEAVETQIANTSAQVGEVAETVDKQTAALETLTQRQLANDARLDSIKALISQGFEIANYVKNNSETIKSPVKSSDDAGILYAMLFGLLNMIINAIALAYKPFRTWVERYLSKGILAVATGIIFTVVAMLTSKGELSFFQALLYLPSLLGTHFTLFTAAKQVQNKETPNVAAQVNA